ncbi:MAG: acyl-[acyl-carrier-protein] thioesterase [Lachnospiraceae bacterium]
MGYSFQSRVRFSEAGENGTLTLPGIMDYFQDCCTFQAESIGHTTKNLIRRNRVWVLSAWQVVVNRYPQQGETIITTTFPYEFRAFLGMRNFTMETEAGEKLAWANSWWSYLNVKTGLPEKLLEEDMRGYILEDKLDMDYAPRKINLPGRNDSSFLAQEPFAVQKHHLDVNHHVNNCQYVHIAQEYLPEGFLPGQVRVEYKKQGRLGDVFYPGVWMDKERIVVSIDNEKHEPYAVMEFKGH